MAAMTSGENPKNDNVVLCTEELMKVLLWIQALGRNVGVTNERLNRGTLP